jgi:hypothetical protein
MGFGDKSHALYLLSTFHHYFKTATQDMQDCVGDLMHIDGPVLIGENIEGCMSMLYFFQIIAGDSALDT